MANHEDFYNECAREYRSEIGHINDKLATICAGAISISVTLVVALGIDRITEDMRIMLLRACACFILCVTLLLICRFASAYSVERNGWKHYLQGSLRSAIFRTPTKEEKETVKAAVRKTESQKKWGRRLYRLMSVLAYITLIAGFVFVFMFISSIPIADYESNQELRTCSQTV